MGLQQAPVADISMGDLERAYPRLGPIESRELRHAVGELFDALDILREKQRETRAAEILVNRRRVKIHSLIDTAV